MKLSPASAALVVFAVLAGAALCVWAWMNRKVKVTASVSVDEEGVTIATVRGDGPTVEYVD